MSRDFGLNGSSCGIGFFCNIFVFGGLRVFFRFLVIGVVVEDIYFEGKKKAELGMREGC